MRLTLLVLLLLITVASAAINAVAANSHPHPHPHPPPTVDECLADLTAYKAKARRFCDSYLHGRMPASVATTVSTISTITLPISQTSTTTTTTISSTSTSVSRAALRRRAIPSVKARTTHSGNVPPSKLHKVYPPEIISEACLLFLYGTLSTTTTATAISTTTLPPTSTATSTVIDTTYTTTTTTTVVPSPTIASPSFEECADASGPVQECGWTFSNGASIESNDEPRTGIKDALLQSQPVDDVSIRQNIASLAPGTRYTIAGYYRLREYDGAPREPQCNLTFSAAPLAGGSSMSSSALITADNFAFGYQPLSLTFTAPSEGAVQFSILWHCTPTDSNHMGIWRVDDFSIAYA